MAYARFGKDSDVYVYESAHGGWVCERCGNFSDLMALKKHLLEHKERGDKVPQRAIDEIQSEIDINPGPKD